MKQHEIATLFTQMADLLEFRGDNPFRIRAYRRAAETLDSFSGDLEQTAREGTLHKLSGIGADLTEKIGEYLSTGKIRAIDKLKRELPRGILGLLEVPGLGPKTARLLADTLHISTVAQLEKAVKAHRLCRLPGFQEKKEQNLLKGIATLKKGRERMWVGTALSLAQVVMARLRKVPGVSRLSTAGSLRRITVHLREDRV